MNSYTNTRKLHKHQMVNFLSATTNICCCRLFWSNSTSRDNMMLLMSFHVMATIYVIAMVAENLECTRVENFRLFYSNCLLEDANVANRSVPMGICARLCTEKYTCTGFAVRQGDCALLDTCPRCCTPSAGDDNRWRVFCPSGKIVYLL